jgi:hypothetical protein
MPRTANVTGVNYLVGAPSYEDDVTHRKTEILAQTPNGVNCYGGPLTFLRSTAARSRREVTPSLWNTLRRW